MFEVERVYFVKTVDGSIDCILLNRAYAVSPTESRVTVYSHIGQHSEGSLDWVYEQKPATRKEYKDLLSEIKGIYGNVLIHGAELATPYPNFQKFTHWSMKHPDRLDDYLEAYYLLKKPIIHKDGLEKDKRFPVYQQWHYGTTLRVLLPALKIR